MIADKQQIADKQHSLTPQQIFLPKTLKESVLTESSQPTQSSLGKVPPGAKMIGNYLLGKKIGEGTFGRVHLAMHMPTSEKVAIKIIDKTNMRQTDRVRVKNEINIMKKIKHRHIVQLYEILETQKSLLLVTEHMSGGQLFHKILKQKKFTEQEACHTFHQIISAVQYLHNNEIAHRDIKPENILIDYDKQVKLIDFGLSSSFSKSKMLHESCGSPCYAAPEIIDGKQSYNPVLSDIWSCGVVLFVMLCGYLPFCDNNANALYQKIKACKYKLPATLSAGARNLIENLLVANPSERLSIQEIKNHEWFNLIPKKNRFGVNLHEHLSIDSELCQSIQKKINISLENLSQFLKDKDKNKETATYFIFMKKYIKNGELVPSYIGNDNFNPSLIITTSEGQVCVIEEITDIEMSPEQTAPSPGSMFDEPITEEIQMSEKELLSIANNIFQMFVDKTEKKINKMKDFIEEEAKNSSGLIGKIREIKQGKFYNNNLNLRKGHLNLHQEKPSKISKKEKKDKSYSLAMIYSSEMRYKRPKEEQMNIKEKKGKKNEVKQLKMPFVWETKSKRPQIQRLKNIYLKEDTRKKILTAIDKPKKIRKLPSVNEQIILSKLKVNERINSKSTNDGKRTLDKN